MLHIATEPTYILINSVPKICFLMKSRDERHCERNLRSEGDKRTPKREWTRFKNRTGGNKNFRPGEREDKPSQNKSDKVCANVMSPQNASKPPDAPNQNKPSDQKPRSGPHRKKLSREQMNSLRAEGKCFNCRETGHEQRNCPKLNLMRPPKPVIKAGSISFAKMEELAERKARVDVYVRSIGIVEPDPITDELRRHEKIELRVHQLCENAWGEDPLWYNEETSPDCKYSIQADDEEITVWDFVNGGNRSFAMKDLDDPSFNIAGIFASPEPNRTSTSVREGGFPCIENYDRWDWPAVSWLHARLTGQLEAVDEGNAPEGIKKNNRIDVQPTMFGYSVQLDESDLIYNLTHKEILDQHFSPERVIDQILTA